MSIELKIKSKVLAEESRIIRQSELKMRDLHRQHLSGRRNSNWYDGTRNELHLHRTGPVRRAARLTGLARGYLTGRSYSSMERPVRKPLRESDLKEIARMVSRYGQTLVETKQIGKWVE